MDDHLLALEKRERFLAIQERVAALYHGSKRPEFLKLLEEAEYAFQAFDVDRAVSVLANAFKLDEDNYELACFLGETCFNEGDLERALTYFERALAVEPEHYQALVYGGVLYHEMENDRRAEELLKRAVALYPDNFLPNFSLGAVYASQEHLSRAVLYLERAVEIESVPQALFLLGNCLYEMGKLTSAIRSLKEAVRQDPAFEEAYHLLGLAYLDRRWTRKALFAFRQAQRLNPKKLRYQDLVSYLSGQADSPLPEVSGEAAEWFAKAEALRDGGNYQKALGALRRALSLDSDNPTLLMTYAVLCLHLDRSQEIEQVARKVLDLDPGELLEAAAYAALIEALRSQGKFRESNRVGRRLLGDERSNFSKTIAYYELAYNLAEMEENLDEALDYARRSLELAPEELKQFPLAALGWVHYKRREYDEAVDFLARSSEVGPSATTLTHLGMALLASGKEEQARSVLARAQSLRPRGEALGEKMMDFMKDSTRLLKRVRSRQKK
jgi:tetratricopeptide (TPR) repeat protein